MKTHISLLGLALVLMATVCKAQADAFGEKTKIAIMPITMQKGDAKQEQYGTLLQEKITEAFVKSKRFELLERSRIAELTGEMQLQEAMADTQVAKLGNTLGAQYLVIGAGLVSAAGLEGTTEYSWGWSASRGSANYSAASTSGNIGWTGIITVNFKVVEVATGKIIKQESLVCKSGEAAKVATGVGVGLRVIGALSGSREVASAGAASQAAARAGSAKSPEEAVSKAIEKLDEKVMKFIDANFPLEIPIISVTPDKKGTGIDGLELACGTELGFEKGDFLKVVKVTEREVMGRKTKTREQLGIVKITAVTGEITSNATVTKGADLIKAALDANKDQVRILFDGSKKAN